MEDPAFWRDLQSQFRSLPCPDDDLSALLGPGGVIVLNGGPRHDDALRASLQNQFRSLAIRGGIAAGAQKERALEVWLDLLRQRSPWFHCVTGSSVENILTDPLDLPVSEIELSANQDSGSEEDQQWHVVVVDPLVDGRYVVVAGHAKYAAAVADGAPSVRCRIRESSTERIDLESGWVDHVCRASTELCTELETEAFAQQHRVDDTALSAHPAPKTSVAPNSLLSEGAEVIAVSPETTTTDAAESKENRSERRRAALLPLLKKKRLNRNKWAVLAGVNRAVVYDYMSGQSTPRDQNATAMAQVIDLPTLPE